MTHFVEIVERDMTITIDGYSTSKTPLGVLHDISRAISNIDCVANQADCYLCNTKADVELLLQCTAKVSCGGFYIEIENVPCATKYNGDTETVEYKDANFYFCTRLVK